MKYVDEYRDEQTTRRLADTLRRRVTRPWTVMEICGGQTHAILRYGIDQLLPAQISLVHGPGCPVCVTPVELIDRALQIAADPEVIFTSFGDMLRVPGSASDLLTAKAQGADVRMVYSPLDALRLAEQCPSRQVVFFAVGFETTAPAHAMAVWQAAQRGIDNFSILSAQVLVPPAIRALLSAPDNVVQGFLAAGHVCAVMGTWQYEPIAASYRLPIVVTGFEPLDVLEGLARVTCLLEQGSVGVENQYRRAVRREGNVRAQRLIAEVFEPCDRHWRGLGLIPEGGLALKAAYSALDADRRFQGGTQRAEEPAECHAGSILRGIKKPVDCPSFGAGCTPDRPLGAPMVSSEGACAAYFRYGSRRSPSPSKPATR